MRIEIENLQAMVFEPSRLPYGRYLIFNFPESGNTKGFLEKLAPLVTAAGVEYQQLLNIGVSHFGLKAMGLPGEVLDSFPVAFSNPFREDILETTGDDTGNWWGKEFKVEEVHCLVHLFANETGILDELTTQVRKFASDSGVIEKFLPSNFEPNTIDLSWPYGPRRLHFGFKDGFSQPNISWEEPVPQVDEGEDPYVSFRHFLIGYDERGSGSSLQKEWFQDSTYAAFRLLKQDVDSFENYLDLNEYKVIRAFPGSGETEEEKKQNRKEWLAAKMLGRWRDGTPLALSPDKPQDSLAKEYFSYEKDDPKGLKCPFTSHIRITNPRDQGGFKKGSLKHFNDVPRLIRRGAPFGPAWPGKNVPRGLAGLFLTSDLQSVELVMSWIQRPTEFTTHIKSPGGGKFFQDPIVGNRVRNGDCVFQFKREQPDRKVTVKGLNEFVSTIGAANLLMPSIKTLKKLIG